MQYQEQHPEFKRELTALERMVLHVSQRELTLWGRMSRGRRRFTKKKCGGISGTNITLSTEEAVSCPPSFLRLDNACIMAVRRDGMTIANVNSFLEMSGADREASEIVNAAGIKISDPVQEPGYGRWVSKVQAPHTYMLMCATSGGETSLCQSE